MSDDNYEKTFAAIRDAKVLNGETVLDVYPMDGKSTACPRCGLEFKELLHAFCLHKICPPREYSKRDHP